PGGILCVRTGARGAFSGGNWMVTLRSPGAPGRCRRGWALVRPFQLNSFTSWRSILGRFRALAGVDRLAESSPRGVNRDIWLILPVVICLSQRLSHACLSISNLYCETANGSLNQLSFI